MCKGNRTRWIAYGTVLVLTMLAMLSAVSLMGCGSAGKGVQLGANDDGTQIILERGQIIVVTLESNPTTGYSWQVVPSDDGVLAQVGEAEFEERPHGKNLVGAGGAETLRFEAKKPGQTTLELVYRRPWEKDEKPAETFSIQVTVE